LGAIKIIEMIIFLFFVFLFGLIFGSFLNALLYRLEKEKDFVWERSCCPKCGKLISWYNNIPLLSFVFLGGKCRDCKKPISWRYPLGEFLTAVLGGVALMAFWPVIGLGLEDISLWIVFFGFYILSVCAVLLGVFLYDLKHYLIPDELLIWGGVVAFLFNIFSDFKFYDFSNLGLSFFTRSLTGSGILAALIAGGFFFGLVYFSREKWMGWGDVKLGLLMGVLLGFPRILAALFLAYLVGAVVSVFLVVLKKKKFKSEVPFGPFLCAATFVVWLWGEEIISWYFRILNF
jgi:prepilin signal peptidase PulO-like enzyme (type II secretory pathway)